MTSCGVILTSWVSIFRCKRPTTFELCYAIFKISATDRRCFFYEEAQRSLAVSPSPRFSHHVYPSPYFWWFCIYSCRFPCRSTFIQSFANFPGYPQRGSCITQSCPSIHGELFSFSHFVFIKLLKTFRWPIWVCSMLVAKKGIATIKSAKPSIIFTWTCRWHSWTLTGINGRSKPLRSEFDTPWCTYYFFLSLSYLILFLMIERMEFVRFRHLLAQPYSTRNVAGCRGCATSPFVHSWSSNPIRRVSAHTHCLSCCAGPLWNWYPGLAASSISCQVAACCPPSHGKSFNQCFLCYSLVNYFLGCLQVRFPAGLLSSGLRHWRLQVPL